MRKKTIGVESWPLGSVPVSSLQRDNADRVIRAKLHQQ